MKHLTDTWRVASGTEEYLFVKAQDGFNIALVTIHPSEDSSRNANLIAAAPEMYALLQTLLVSRLNMDTKISELLKKIN